MSTNAKTRYNISKVFGPAVPDKGSKDSDPTADNMAGIAINGKTAYCAKRSQTSSNIFVIENIASASFDALNGKTPVSIPYAVHGMTYHNNYLYMTCYKNTIIKMPVSSIGKIAAEYTVTEDGNGYIPQSITYYGTVNNEDLFIVGVEKMQKNGAFFYMIGSLSNGKFVEKKRFYVNNSAGYEQPQDIFYHSKYGLFIVTNKKADGAFTIYNMLLCAKIPDELSSVENIGTYYPTSEFRFNGNSNYSKLVVKSIYITDDGTLYLSTNATSAPSVLEKYSKDAIFRATNPVFKKDGMLEMALSCNGDTEIPNAVGTYNNSTYSCINPGAFTLDGNTGYCFKTHTTKDTVLRDKISILFKSSDVSSQNFSEAFSPRKLFTELGHCNGMVFVNGFLYVAAYDRYTTPERKQITKINPSTGKIVETYECDSMFGGIGYYGNNKFIVLNYEQLAEEPAFSQTLHFYIGSFKNGRFDSEKEFTVNNPFYLSKVTVLQDIHYDINHGLFFITHRTDVEISKIYRINPDKITNASVKEPLIPDEVFIPDSSISEIESVCIASSGIMYIVQNKSTSKPDLVSKVSGLTFSN